MDGEDTEMAANMANPDEGSLIDEKRREGREKESFVTIKRLDTFEMSIPKTCLWCSRCSVLPDTEDSLDAVVCLDWEKTKTFKKGRPSDREVRTYLKVMESDETCDRWRPTRPGTRHFESLRDLGVVPQGW